MVGIYCSLLIISVCLLNLSWLFALTLLWEAAAPGESNLSDANQRQDEVQEEPQEVEAEQPLAEAEGGKGVESELAAKYAVNSKWVLCPTTGERSDSEEAYLATVQQVTGCTVMFKCDWDEEVVEPFNFPGDAGRVIRASREGDAAKFRAKQ